jgi:ADP-ribose pyrophosphatase
MPAKATRSLIYRGRKFDFEQIEFVGSDGKLLRREVVRHPGAVVILPILADGHVVLIRNHRPSVERALWELPAGTLEQGEDPRACAERELIEETGYEAATIEPLGRFYTSPGLSDELMIAFVALGLTQVGQRLEPDEDLTVHCVRSGEALEMVDSGELMDGKSMLTLLLGLRKGVLRI